MALFKCKMCGGTLEITSNESVAVCEYCGTQQTLPRLDDDRKANLYDRANHFRRNNEFDKAMGIYEQILNEDSADAEAYWSVVLCRYGIEYVEDPASHKRVPTVNRAQFTSIFDDDNYKSALQYADVSQKSIYEEEAKTINEIQKGILSISQREEPFDVFICYKETDNSGRRTPDSVLANELYHELTEEGFKVFFSRITLEDKIGSAYEPYIFAALNSAKVMVALGTKPEYFQAPWEKNEWSRYLALIRNGAKKTLIPAYKDMDPYDLPEEFSHLQAQDMSKLGFMQDIIHGIKKMADKGETRRTDVHEAVVGSTGVNKAPLLKRVFIFLEDGDWESADEYCEKVLDIDPETAQAYLGKLMAELRVHKQEELADCEQPFSDSNNYQKVLRFGDDALKNTLQGYIEHINVRNENARLESLYSKAVQFMNAAASESSYWEAAEQFLPIIEYKDSAARRDKCQEKAKIYQKDAIYDEARASMHENFSDRREGFRHAILKFQEISGWEDADEQIEICKRRIEEIEQQDREAARRKKIITVTTAIIVCAAIAITVFVYYVVIPNVKYNAAVALIDEGSYEEAYKQLTALDGYRDSIEKADELKNVTIPDEKYNTALAWIEKGDYENAYEQLTALDGYKDSKEKADELKNVTIPDEKYNTALAWIEEGDYENAYEQLAALDGYKDSKEKAETIRFEYEVIKVKKAEVGDYIGFGAYDLDKDESNGKENIEWLVLAKEENRILVISKYAFAYLTYHKKNKEVIWKSCSLRKWLNGAFMADAFSDREKAMIPTVKIESERVRTEREFDAKEMTYGDLLIIRSPDKITKDQVFLLSVAEVEKIFPSYEERKCKMYPEQSTSDCRWLLRSPGWEQSYVASVSSNGNIDEYGNKVNMKGPIRPAMWIDWNSEEGKD